MEDFDFVELFAGIGGVSFGFERQGGKCLLACEYDPTTKIQYAQNAYKLLHPQTKIVGDVKEIKTETLPNMDILSFTTPCQSFSLAGKRLGFEDTRGTLVFEALRIAKDKQPKILFMENVKGLLIHDKGRTFKTILNAMNDVGYYVDFNILNSKYYNSGQNRERTYVIGVHKDLIQSEKWSTTSMNKSVNKFKEVNKEDLETFNFNWNEQNTVNVFLNDVLEEDPGKEFFFDEAIENKIKNEIDYTTVTKKNDIKKLIFNMPYYKRKYALNVERLKEFLKQSKKESGLSITDIAEKLDVSKTEAEHWFRTDDYFAPPRKEKWPQLKELLEIKTNEFDKALTEFILADGVFDKHNRFYLPEGISPTLLCGGNEKVIIRDKGIIRKITPLETMRLQTFEDEYYETLVSNGFSHSRIYKFSGNTVTINVIEHLAKQIKELLESLT